MTLRTLAILFVIAVLGAAWWSLNSTSSGEIGRIALQNYSVISPSEPPSLDRTTRDMTVAKIKDPPLVNISEANAQKVPTIVVNEGLAMAPKASHPDPRDPREWMTFLKKSLLKPVEIDLLGLTWGQAIHRLEEVCQISILWGTEFKNLQQERVVETSHGMTGCEVLDSLVNTMELKGVREPAWILKNGAVYVGSLEKFSEWGYWRLQEGIIEQVPGSHLEKVQAKRDLNETERALKERLQVEINELSAAPTVERRFLQLEEEYGIKFWIHADVDVGVQIKRPISFKGCTLEQYLHLLVDVLDQAAPANGVDSGDVHMEIREDFIHILRR